MTVRPDPALAQAMQAVDEAKDYDAQTVATKRLQEIEEEEVVFAAGLFAESREKFKEYLQERVRVQALYVLRYSSWDGATLTTRIKDEFRKAIEVAIKDILYVDVWSSKADLKGEYANQIQARVRKHAEKVLESFEMDHEKWIKPDATKMMKLFQLHYQSVFEKQIQELARTRATEDARKALDLVLGAEFKRT